MGYVEEIRQLVGHRPLILPGSVVMVIDNKDRVLMQRRKSTSYGKWGLPGGIMELGETLEDTAIREVKEEAGLEIGELTLLDLYSGPNNFMEASNGDQFYVVTAAYWTKEFKGEVKIDRNESLDMKFIELDNLPDEIVKSHRRFIEKYIKENHRR